MAETSGIQYDSVGGEVERKEVEVEVGVGAGAGAGVGGREEGEIFSRQKPYIKFFGGKIF